MSMPSPTMWLIILAIVLLLFGATRLPKLARSMGQSARIFKDEVKDLREDDRPEEKADAEDREVEGRVIDGETPRTSEAERNNQR
ncbi:Sec-independent protein translocase subunit TatA [Nesterenkonia populi]|uniref:Sec-independent protein translocase subunit TatA n=1 Tax=Nesterenkonia populi TaxID=1591087 RepID=UPI001B873B62|nr:Sec-independent protein translocase subunit TatA [Nesterenkonia populi]